MAAAGCGCIVSSVYILITGLQLGKHITVGGALVYGLDAHKPLIVNNYAIIVQASVDSMFSGHHN